MKKPKVTALLAAGGTGRRFGGARPKQFALLRGKPILAHSLSVFGKAAVIDEIVLVAPEAFMAQTQADIVEPLGEPKIKAVVAGGENRQASVYNALQFLKRHGSDSDIVLIHDGVRPLATERLINAVVESVLSGNAAVPGLPIIETLKRADADGRVTATQDRSQLFSIQTPQGFPLGIIIKAYEKAMADGFWGTDDAALAERLGAIPVVVVRGDKHNIKITTPEDMEYAEWRLSLSHTTYEMG